MRLNSGIALPKAAPPRATVPTPHGPRLRSHATGTWFELLSPFGPLRLCVDAGAEPARHAAEAAVTLHRVEPMLAALDRWLGGPPDWAWIDAPVAPDDGSAVATPCQGPGGTDCRIVWPWALLRALPAPPAPFSDRIEWPLVPAVLALARLQLDAEEFASLEPGGAVLLPASMQGPWHGLLRAADEPASAAGVPVDLATPWRPRLAERRAAPAAPTPLDPLRIACELRLDLPLGVSATRLAGWRRDGDAGELVHLAEAGLRVALWCSATPRHAERALASGRLMPWGDGWAVAIEALSDTPSEGGLQKS